MIHTLHISKRTNLIFETHVFLYIYFFVCILKQSQLHGYITFIEQDRNAFDFVFIKLFNYFFYFNQIEFYFK